MTSWNGNRKASRLIAIHLDGLEVLEQGHAVDQGVRSLRVMTLSPWSALIGIAWRVAPGRMLSNSSQMPSNTSRSNHEIHLVDAST